jgi:hypothetical protein
VFFTKLILEKEDPKNPEFVVPFRLKEFFKAKDFGQYRKDGKMITCFLTNKDITGGNSGSPQLMETLNLSASPLTATGKP